MDNKDQQKILDFIKNQQLAVLGTTSTDCEPHAALVEFIMDDTWHMYVVTLKNTQKVKDIKENILVSFVTGLQPSPNAVQIEGHGEIINSHAEEFNEVLKLFHNKKMFYTNPIIKFQKDHIAIIKVYCTLIRLLEFNEKNGKEEYTDLRIGNDS